MASEGTANSNGILTLTNCTINGNYATYTGGGVGKRATATLTDCTISGNSAGDGVGGLANDTSEYQYTWGSTTKLIDTIVAGNTDTSSSTASDIVSGNNVTGSDNLIGTGGAGGLQNGVDGNIILPSLSSLGLAPLGFYGGPTETMALLPGSPALGAGVAVTGVTTDQRGLPLDSPHPDIGAFQSQPELVVNTTSDASYGILSPAGELSLRQAVGLANFLGGPQTITFAPTVFATAQTITLTAGPLELSNTSGTETITGPGAGVTINGGGVSPVFQVESGVTASISGLTITGGSSLAADVLDSGGTLTLSHCTINSSTTAVQVVYKATATITASTFSGEGTGILVGATAVDTCTVTAHDDNLSGETIGVQNVQTTDSVNALLNWWGSSAGPGSPGAAIALGLVNASPWLANLASLSLATPNALGFTSTTGNQYVVTANPAGPTLGITLGGSPVGTVSAGGTIVFTGNGGSVTINGETGADSFTITNTAVTFAAADAFKNSTIQFNDNLSLDWVINAQGTTNSFNMSNCTGEGTLNAPPGTGTVVASKAAGYTLSNSALSSTDGMHLTLNGITKANLTDTSGGGKMFTVSGWTGTGSLTGSTTKTDIVTVTESASFGLSNTALTAGSMSLGLSNITTANLTASGSGRSFTVTGWTGNGSLTGTSATVVATESASVTLTNSSLKSGTMSLKLSGITAANLTVTASTGKPSYVIDASAFTEGPTNLTATGTVNAILYSGSAGHDTLTAAGSGNDILIGNGAHDTLSDTGTGSNILVGAGTGGDTITGNGNDILVSGVTKYDSDTSANITALDAILAEWTSSDSYATRISKIMSGVGPGQAYAFNSSTITPNHNANTLSDGSSQPQNNNWFIASSQDTVKKRSNETATIL